MRNRPLLFGYVLIAAAVFLLSFVYILRLQPTYESGALLMAKETKGDAPTGGAAGLATKLLGVGGLGQDTQFDKFKKFWGSRDVAARMIAADPSVLRKTFPQNWNTKTGQWRTAPHTAPEFLSAFFNGLFGMKQVYEPGSTDLADYIRRSIPLQEEDTGTALRVNYSSPDAQWAYHLLQTAIAQTDATVRDAEHRRSTEFINFARDRLGHETNVEYQQALIDTLRQYEMSNMYAQAGENFSFQYVEHPVVPARYAFPRPLLFTLLALVFANLTAIFVILATVMWPDARPRRWLEDFHARAFGWWDRRAGKFGHDGSAL